MQVTQILFFFAAAVAWTLVGAAIIHTDCGSTIEVKLVQVIPCTRNPCEVTKGESSTIKFNFRAHTEAHIPTKAKVNGVRGSVTLPFRLQDTQVCGHVRPGCPIKTRTWYTYSMTLQIASWYPQIQVSVRWELMNKSQTKVVCVQIPVQIVAKKSNRRQRS